MSVYVSRRALAYSRLEHDAEFRTRLLRHPGLSPTEIATAALAEGYWLDRIGEAQSPPCQRRLVWEDK